MSKAPTANSTPVSSASGPVSVPVSAPAASGVPIPDVQGSRDTRNVAIDRVGVKDVTYPMRLAISPCSVNGTTPDGRPAEQTTVAKINMYVALPHYQKGTHMSRFLEVLNEHDKAITPGDIPQVTQAIRERLGAQEAHFAATFTYFVKKLAPITKQPGLMDYQVTFECTSTAAGEGQADATDFVMSVRAPATSLCPCSKEISRYGAHNQRCVIEAKVRTSSLMWIEELVRMLEKAASAELFAVLKRPDEKFVTEAAYDNPKFVEDIVRDLALILQRDERITWYAISSENFESIHNHSAYAEITRRLR